MSDEEREVDVESGEEDEPEENRPKSFNTLAEKRAHHNFLERKRRDHIKDSFSGLRDCIPSLEGEKSSRAQILHKATEHIQYMRRKNHSHQADIDELKRHNMILDQQVRQLEKARSTGTLTLDPATAALLNPELLLQPTPQDNVMGVQGEQLPVVQSTATEAITKNEGTVIMDRPNPTSDHDDYTIAPKRMKHEPP